MAILSRYRPGVLGRSLTSRYDKAYFDKWYRHPHHRVKSVTELRRQVAFVLRFAEWVLDRPVRTVLDVGCGEGQWKRELERLRPGIRYDGVDPSAYAAERYGTRRNIQHGGIADLDQLPLRASYDLVVSVGMLNYLALNDLKDGMAQVARRTGGMAYLELFSRDDAIEGDTNWPKPKTAAWYRQLMQSAGLQSVGMHGYVPQTRAACLAALERA